MGKASRRKGHDAEAEMARYLRANGYPDARTTRAVLGHSGTKQPGDISFDDRVYLEVKNVKHSRFPTWCAKALEERDGRVPVVVKRATPDVAKWWTMTLCHCTSEDVAFPSYVEMRGDAVECHAPLGMVRPPKGWHTIRFGDWLTQWRQAGDL